MSVRSSALIGIGAIVFLLGLGAWLIGDLVHDTVRARHRLDHTYEVLERTASVRIALLRERLAVAQLLAVANEGAAEAAQAELQDASSGIVLLLQLLADNPQQAARVQAVREIADEFTAAAGQVVEAVMAGDLARAREIYAHAGAGQGRALLDEIAETERDLLRKRDDASKSSNSRVVRSLVGVFVLLIAAVTSAVMALVTRELRTKRLLAELGQAMGRAEELNVQLTQSQQRLQATLDRARDAIVVVGEAGTVELANSAAGALFDREAETLIGRPPPPALPPPMIGAPSEAEVTIDRPDGSAIRAEISTGMLEHEGRRTAIHILRDISKRHRLDELKNEFISTVSHELRTPLTSIRGSLALVVGGVAGDLPEKAMTLLDIAHKNVQRLASLVNDILDIEKIESGRLEFKQEPIAVADVVRSAIEVNSSFAQQFDAELHLLAPVAPELLVAGDADRLVQVLTNLLSNAVKFSPDGAPVDIAVDADAHEVSITVTDRGPGIPESFKPRIFQRFAQGDSSDVRRAGGTGLGLSIAKAIVDRHGGRIGFESPLEDDRGTRFWVRLPRLATAALEDTTPRPRVLICEDNADVATLLAMLLAQDGWNPEIVHDAKTALRRLSESDYQAMTVDLQLPGTDGLELIRRAGRMPRSAAMPIAVVSGHARGLEPGRDAELANVVDWLEKPIDQSRLRQSLRRAIEASNQGVLQILHIEDDSDVVAVVAAILDGRAEVVQARTSADARDQLATRRFSLVILDSGLPDGSGLNLIELLHSRYTGTPVVLLSAGNYDQRYSSMVSAALVKGRTDNQEIAAVILRLLGTPKPEPAVDRQDDGAVAKADAG